MEYVKEYIVDAFLVLIFLINVYVYYKKSFVKAVLEFFSFFASAFVARIYSEKVADFVMDNTTLFSGEDGKLKSRLIFVVLLFILTSAVLKAVIYYIDKLFNLPVINTANKMLGLLLGILIGIFVVGLCVALFKVFELSGYEPLIELVEKSRIIKISSGIIAKGYPYIAEYIKKGV